jgi:hypothetical protein
MVGEADTFTAPWVQLHSAKQNFTATQLHFAKQNFTPIYRAVGSINWSLPVATRGHLW